MNETQDRALEEARAAYKEYRKGRRTALARAKNAAEVEVAELRRRAALTALHATEVGVSLRKIGREAMNTSNYDTVRQLIGDADIIGLRAEAKENAARTIADQKRAEVTLSRHGAGEYLLTLAGEELEIAKSAAEWGQTFVSPEHAQALLQLHESGAFVPVTGGWLADIGEQHPVVAWLSKSHSKAKLAAALETLSDESEAA